MKLSHAILLLFLPLFSACSKQSEEPGRPNIILIMADDLGYNELGAYGQTKIETPYLDALAANGMKFTQAYAGSAVCAPSRCVLMTGKHTGHAFLRGNDEMPERGDVWSFQAMWENPELEGQLPLPDSTVTLAERLKEAGYRTGLVGKWGLGGPFTAGHPNKQGFDYFYGYLCQRQAHTYYPTHLWENQERVILENQLVDPHKSHLPENADPMDPESYALFHDQPDYAPDLMMEKTIAFIEKNHDFPFFLYVPTVIPHVSLQAPPEWVAHYREKFGDEAPYTSKNGGGYLPVRYPRATYAAMISYMDEQVGQIVKKLEELDIKDNTLIIFTSDNGPSYAGGADPEYFNSAAPFKGSKGWAKGSLHEGGIRIPLIASWENHITPGSTSEHLLAFWDILPTFCELAGVQPPSDIDGMSFLPALRGKEEKQTEHDYLYWEFPESGGQQAVRLGKWKGIRKNMISKGNLEIALYNLENDIQETHNVAAQYPEITARIAQIMQKEHAQPEVATFNIPVLSK